MGRKKVKESNEEVETTGEIEKVDSQETGLRRSSRKHRPVEHISCKLFILLI